MCWGRGGAWPTVNISCLHPHSPPYFWTQCYPVGLGLKCSARLAAQQAPRDSSVSNPKLIIPYANVKCHTQICTRMLRSVCGKHFTGRALPLSTLSVPLHTCGSAADSMQFPMGAHKNNPVNLKVPDGRSLQFKEPDSPQLKDTRQPTELWRASRAQTDCQLETHLLCWLKKLLKFETNSPTNL